MDAEWARDLLAHPDASVRFWTVRLLNPTVSNLRLLHDTLIVLARSEADAEARSELADATARLEPAAALAVLQELIRREDAPDKHVPLRIWWALEERITRDADGVLSWFEKAGLWQAPLFGQHLAGRIARRLAADRGDSPSFTRVDPDTNWKQYAWHPRSRMPGGKGDYTEWATNYTPEVSDRNLTRLARLLEWRRPHPRSHDRWCQCWTGTRPARATDTPAPLGPLGDAWQAGSASHSRCHDRARQERVPDPLCAVSSDGRERDAEARPAAEELALVLGSEDLLGRIVLNGLKGEMLMPAMGTLDDQQLSAILTYVRGACRQRPDRFRPRPSPGSGRAPKDVLRRGHRPSSWRWAAVSSGARTLSPHGRQGPA